MIETLALALVWALQLYLLVGLFCAVALSVRGLGALDPAARDASLGFRVLVFPGLVALWPILMRRWRSGAPPPVESNAHRSAADASE